MVIKTLPFFSFRKGLIYLDVPITSVDRVQVPPLQGFVMNRILGDYFETLLYKIFVSIDEHTTVGEVINSLFDMYNMLLITFSSQPFFKLM